MKLTDAEVLARREELAGVRTDIVHLEAAAKNSAAGFKGKIGEKEARSAELSDVIKNRVEHREIEVFEEKLYREGIARTIRRDTDEEISTRPLRPEEMTAWRQGSLSLVGDQKPKVVATVTLTPGTIVTTEPTPTPENR